MTLWAWFVNTKEQWPTNVDGVVSWVCEQKRAVTYPHRWRCGPPLPGRVHAEQRHPQSWWHCKTLTTARPGTPQRCLSKKGSHSFTSKACTWCIHNHTVPKTNVCSHFPNEWTTCMDVRRQVFKVQMNVPASVWFIIILSKWKFNICTLCTKSENISDWTQHGLVPEYQVWDMDIIIYLYIFIYIKYDIFLLCSCVCSGGGGGWGGGGGVVGTRVQEIQYQLSCLDKIN